jgi:anti-sigma factor RsiW
MNDPTVTEEDLHRYVDGALQPAQRERVDAWLAGQRDVMIRLQKIRTLNSSLHGRFDDVLTEPIPARLTRELARGQQPRRTLLAASIAALAVGTLLGWFGHSWSLGGNVKREAVSASAAPPPSFPRQAILAHAAYTPEVRHPVEVTVQDEAHLFTWLSKRLGNAIKPARLSAQGFELMGGRMLPGEDGPVAQFMYQNAAGKRLTLMLTRKQSAGTDTAFRFYDERNISVFYWVDGPFGYALSGDIPRAELQVIATTVYQQRNP